MHVLIWIPQVQSNKISIESTKRIKPRLLTALKLRYIPTKEDNLKRMVLYFRIVEPNALNIVNQYMHDNGVTETNFPFWYNVNDSESILKVSSQNCKCCVGFEKMLNIILL